MNEMARRSYGHGRWGAPYWFLGPEGGMAHSENTDLTRRVKAWRDLGGGELNDCPTFHDRIGEERWHRERPRPQLQPTWRPLILLLMSYQGRRTDSESLRNYQRDEWGTLDGETCVIELSALAARNLGIPRKRDWYRKERIEEIRQRMDFHKPKFAVMYGKKQREHWSAIAEHTFSSDNIWKRGPTNIALTRHPVRSPNDCWIKLGERLR
jgi:hypothetical protein